MRLHQPLDTICDSPVKVRLLRFLCQKGGEWTGRRLAAALGLNPVTAHKALRRLHEATVLDLRRAGNSFVYSLRDDHDLVRTLLRPLFERESRTLPRVAELIRRAIGPKDRAAIVTVAIYGSVARGQERPTSDLDLFILVPSRSAKAVAQRVVDRLWEPLTRTFGNAPALYVATVREMQQKVRRHQPLAQNILRDHQVVWGKPLAEALRDGAA